MSKAACTKKDCAFYVSPIGKGGTCGFFRPCSTAADCPTGMACIDLGGTPGCPSCDVAMRRCVP